MLNAVGDETSRQTEAGGNPPQLPAKQSRVGRIGIVGLRTDGSDVMTLSKFLAWMGLISLTHGAARLQVQVQDFINSPIRVAIAHLHDDVTREKDCGKCSQRSNMASKSGGFTCCVPGCFNNNKRNRNLSFYVFPQNEKLRKVWLRKISRKGFKLTSGHRVCSEHFEGEKKTYTNNIPTIFPLKTHQKSKSSERRPLIRDYNASERYKSQTGATASTIAAAPTTERVSLEEEIKKLQSKLDSLSLENERLQTEMNSLKFGLNRFIGSDVDMNYYTGMSAQHFLAFFAFLDAGGICSRLRYWGSNNSRIQYPEVEKKGQKRLLEPRDELFLTLVRLRVNIPEKVLADNYKISVAEVSRIFVTWLDLIYSRLIQ